MFKSLGILSFALVLFAAPAFAQPDLEPAAVELIDPLTHLPTRQGLFGETGRIRVEVANLGTATASGFKVGVLLSANSTPSLLADDLLHEEAVTSIPAGGTQTFEFNFQFPSDFKGQPYTSGPYYVFAYVDSSNAVAELNESNNARSVGTNGLAEQIFLRTPAADHVVAHIAAPTTAAVAEVIPVSRVFRNAGNMPGKAVAYRYVVSANRIIDASDPTLKIIGDNGELVEFGTVTLDAGATDARTELVQVPATLQPGTWFVGAILDVANVDEELDETNNGLSAAYATEVAGSSLVILSTQLPDATALLPYSFKLFTTPADGPVQWKLGEGTLPEGLGLSTDGVLSGTPTNVGVFSFTAEAATTSRSATARVVLRVLPGQGQLVITTESLAPVVNSPQRTYEAQLAAAGGSREYRWALVSGLLPTGLSLSTAGKISGAARSGVRNGDWPFEVEVTDALGSRARTSMVLTVIPAAGLDIVTGSLPDAIVGTEYFADLSARNLDGSSLATPLNWTLVSGRLPNGLTLSTVAGATGLINGTPAEPGVFSFALQVIDDRGRIDSRAFVFNVHAKTLQVTATNVPGPLHPGDSVSMLVSTGDESSRYRLYSGALPPGVVIDEAGNISGTIAESDSLGTWSFVVEAQTPGAGASLGSFAIDVVPVTVAQGCGVAPGSGGAMGLLSLLTLVFFRLRRSS